MSSWTPRRQGREHRRSDAPQDTELVRTKDDPGGYSIIARQGAQGFFAADRILFLYRPAIHTEHTWQPSPDEQVVEGVATDPGIRRAFATPGSTQTDDHLPLQLVALKPDLTPATPSDEPAIVASACEVAEHIEGPVAGRIVRILYRIANDPPYWRHPRITVDVYALLDELGYTRDDRGYHNTINRTRVRDILQALSRVEIRGERFVGDGNREVYRAPLLYIRGGLYREQETEGIDLARIFEEGLPRTLHLELGWYSGVRRANGELGNNYVLLPRSLATYTDAAQADHQATEERLADFLWMRYSLGQSRSPTLTLTLEVALRRSGITNKNITRARDTLQKALDRLVKGHQVLRYSALPLRRSSSFTVTLAVPDAKERAHAKAGVEAPSMWDLVEQDEEPARVVPADPAEAAEAQPGDGQAGDTPAPLAAQSLFPVMSFGSHRLGARQVWEDLIEALLPQVPAWRVNAVTLHKWQALWRAETLPDGDVVYWLYLGRPSGHPHLLPAVEATLNRIIDGKYGQTFGLQVGPELALPTTDTSALTE